MSDYRAALVEHSAQFWGEPVATHRPTGGRSNELPPEFRVVEFALITGDRVFCTCGLGSGNDRASLELHVIVRRSSLRHVDMLAVVSHYHLTGAELGLGHTVNMGEPWLPGGTCTHAYLSLPYVYGPKLERFVFADRETRCLWLIPITAAERKFKFERGAEALEQLFESQPFNYTDLARASLV